MRQGKNLVSNSDFNGKRGEEYLISSSFASENIVGGGQLSFNFNESCTPRYSGVGFISRYAEGGDWHLSSVISSNDVNIPELMFGGGEIYLDSSSRRGASHYLDLPFIHEMASLWKEVQAV